MRNLLFLAVVAAFFALGACKNKGVKTEHGYMFINHTNKGGTKPEAGQTVLVNVYTYLGDSLMGSTVRDFGGPRPITLYTPDKMPKKVPPIFDAVMLMSEGDSATVLQEIDSTIRKNIPPALKDAKEVRYEVVLIDVITAEEKAQKEQASQALLQTVVAQANSTLADYKAGKLAGKITKMPDGLEVLVLDKGTGAPIQAGQKAKVNYYGYFMTDGKMFDNSFERGEAMSFTVGQMIPGFDEGVQQLNVGGKAYFFIPWKLGYGEQGGGPIPPKTDLVFYVEMM